MRTPGLVRIVFELDPQAWHGSATERLWAEPVGTGRFRLRNSPFFAFGVSAEDVVAGEDRDGQLYFAGVSIRGGHSTYRLKLAAPVRDTAGFHECWKPLEELGCMYEEGPVLSVDVPPPADIQSVYRLLEAGANSHVWDFEEGHCGHPLSTRRVAGRTLGPPCVRSLQCC